MKTSLVTGGAGFIGSHIADHLLKMGHQVIVLDDLSGGLRENVNKKCIFLKGSITNIKILNKIFENYNIDYVFHLAAYAAEGLSHFIRKFNYENNVIGSINLINLSVKNNVEHFVFTSSIAVYGKNQLPMTEELTPMPEDPYGIAKYAVELDLRAAFEMFGLPYTIFRPHNVYGPKQNHGDPYRNVLGIFINNVMKGKPMTIFGDGKQTRAFTYIDDVAPYIARCIEIHKAQNEVFNIGADKPYEVLELAKMIARCMKVESKIQFLPSRKEVLHAYSDHTKVKSIFNTTSEIPLSIGIKKMIEWCQRIGPRDSKNFKNIELKKNMPPSWQKLTSGTLADE